METILVIDDDKTMREMMCVALRRAGFDVVETGDGDAGFGLFLTAQPAVVVVDLQMPPPSGRETIRRLLDHDPNTRIIATSGDFTGEPSDSDRVSQTLGVTGVLPKPFRQGTLVSLVRRALGTP